MKKKIYLIRHGKTYCNEKQLYCGKTDIDLSESGRKELESRDINIYPKCDFYFTSGLKRANSTLEIICPDKKYTVINEFSEYNFGDFELKSYEDLKDLKEYQDWIIDETQNVCCPNGESKLEFRNRIEKAFDKLIKYMFKENKETSLGVIHGGAIGIILEIKYDDSKKIL
ncbi:MAG: histidine phosphatase family protein [Clostridium neonatale]